MPASEIDDIFSGVASSSKAVISEPVVKKKKGSKKRKAERETEARPDLVPVKNVSSGKVKEKTDEPKKKKIAETVVDPSKIIEARVAKKRKGTTASQKLNEEDEDFRDTRGKNSEFKWSDGRIDLFFIRS